MENMLNVPSTVKGHVKEALKNQTDVTLGRMTDNMFREHPVFNILGNRGSELREVLDDYYDALGLFGRSSNRKRGIENALDVITPYLDTMEYHYKSLGLDYEDVIGEDGSFRYVVMQAFNVIYELAKFNLYGRRVLKITDPELKKRLSETDFKNIRMGDLNIPFESFYIDIGIKETAEYKEDTPRIPLNRERIYKRLNGKISINIEGIIISRYPDGYNFYCLHETSIYGDILNKEGNIVGKMQKTLEYPLTIPVFNDGDDDMNTITEKIARSSTTLFPGSLEFYETASKAFRKGVSLAMNTILYASYVNKRRKEKLIEEKPLSDDFRITPFPMSKKAAKRNSGKYYYTFLKASSENKKTWKRENEKVSESKRNGGKPFLVRGHWRNQPYGSRENPEYKLKWIEPYWKNLTPGKEKNGVEPDSEEKYRIYTMR